MFQIRGKVALLIGACKGVGLELAKQLLQQDARAIVIADTNAELARNVIQTLKDEFGEMRVVLLQADILNPKELEAVYINVIKLFNQMDIVINNVGLIDENDVDLSQNNSMLVAMRSTKLAVNAYLPQYKMGTEGVVININAVVTLGNSPGLSGSNWSGLTAGIQYERNNVRVISLFLGCTQSEILGGLSVNQLVQKVERIPELRIQPGLESVGRALINAIEQGAHGSSWVGIKQQQQQPSTDALMQGNWSLRQMQL